MPTIVLTSGTSWTVPADWNSAANTIEGIGAGGTAGTLSSGGGGGAYARVSNVTLTPGASIPIQIGTAGAGGVADTIFNTSTMIAQGAVQNNGGSTAGSTGTVKFDGGQGGSPSGGGGGAAGPNGAGQGGRGDGSDQGGGAGDNGFGGAGGVGSGTAGSNGTNMNGGVGAGGGGSGIGSGAAGLYGAGGGFSAGTPAQGVLVITYTAFTSVPLPVLQIPNRRHDVVSY